MAPIGEFWKAEKLESDLDDPVYFVFGKIQEIQAVLKLHSEGKRCKACSPLHQYLMGGGGGGGCCVIKVINCMIKSWSVLQAGIDSRSLLSEILDTNLSCESLPEIDSLRYRHF